MEAIWFLIIIVSTISTCALLRALLNLFSPCNNKAYMLPPGPRILPVIGLLTWMKKSFTEIELIIRSLQAKLGPIITLRVGSQPSIFITNASIAHQALVENGILFSTRPPPSTVGEIAISNHTMINTSVYGPTWRILRRNLASEILHPRKVKLYSHTRRWALKLLLQRLESQSNSGLYPVNVNKNCEHALFCLLVPMCFGDDLEEKQIEEIVKVEQPVIDISWRFVIKHFLPSFSKILLWKRRTEIVQIFKERAEAVIPFVRARISKLLMENSHQEEDSSPVLLSYVDTLLTLQLPADNNEEKRKLTELEIVSLCSEFLHGSTDTTSTALQWIMANLVKQPRIQEKLFMEIKGVVKEGEEEITEEQLQRMPYLKAIILEGLRRHPPTHRLLPHSVTEDAVLGNYLVPKNANIHFMIADMGWDPKVWEDPMAFKPERFMGKEFDITASKEIKMMPFGAGRRMCPGYSVGILLLEYFVANFIWNFEWKAVNEVDLSEKVEFTVAMKNPLLANIVRRFK